MFHTELDLLPQEGVGLFYSFNSRGRENAVYGLRKAVLDQFLQRYFPPTAAAPAPANLSSAVADARKIAGRYESSRRVEHGFLSVFYLLQQTVIGANSDGTITAPHAFEPGEGQFREVAPDIWQEIGGTRELAWRDANGLGTVIDSEDPTSVLERVPFRRAAPLNLTVLLGSFVIVALTVALWPVGYLLRRHYQRPLAYPAAGRRLWLSLRAAAAFDLVWLVCWAIVLLPVVSVQLDFYSTALDPVIRALQIAGLIVVALAAKGAWCLWRLSSFEQSWWYRMGNGLIVAALFGLVWIGFIGGLIGFNLNY